MSSLNHAWSGLVSGLIVRRLVAWRLVHGLVLRLNAWWRERPALCAERRGVHGERRRAYAAQCRH